MTEHSPEEHQPVRRVPGEDLQGCSREHDRGETSDVASSSSALAPLPPPLPTGASRAPGLGEGGEPTPVMDGDWTPDYRADKWWSGVLDEVTKGDQWPVRIIYRQKRLYQDGLLCVPSAHVKSVIRLHHAQAGHPGGDRLWPELQRWYVFPSNTEAKKFYHQGTEHLFFLMGGLSGRSGSGRFGPFFPGGSPHE